MTRKRAFKREIKKFNDNSPFLSSNRERDWIEYARKNLHSIWSLNDDGFIFRKRKAHNSVSLIHSLAKDIESFDLPDEFKSNEAHIWNIYRKITVSRVKCSAIELYGMARFLEKVERNTEVRFNSILNKLIFSAKIECYISLYILLINNHTTETIISYSEVDLFVDIISSYNKLLDFSDSISNQETDPNHALFPNNSYLIARVLTLIEDIFSSENDAYEYALLNEIMYDSRNLIYLNKKEIKEESFTENGENKINNLIDTELVRLPDCYYDDSHNGALQVASN